MSKPSKRTVLPLLTVKRLAGLCDELEVDRTGLTLKDDLVDALARAKTASLAAILAALSRNEIKEICRAFELDDSGKEKAPLVARILGDKASEPVIHQTSKKKSAKASDKPRRNAVVTDETGQVELPSGGKLSVAELEKYLWSAADILRGSIDSSDYKSFIFGLMFLKRLSDRFEEEAEKLVAGGEDPEVAWEDRDYHQFFVPPAARWAKLQQQATNVGDALNKACAKLEEENDALEGVLLGIDYNDPNRLGDTKNRDSVLGRLVQHFGKLRLRNEDLAEPDMLGRAYEYLIEKFADDAGKKGGEFYTPHKVVETIVAVLAPKEGMRICDPTCGSGGMLIQCTKYIKAHGGNPQNVTLHGQEKNLGTWGICKMNMLLHDRPSSRIEKGDTIRDPKLVEGGALILYDRVIANPPFSLDQWGQDDAKADRYGRFRFGLPPKTKADFAFVQHMVAIMKPQGKMAVIMPHGVLFRGGAEGKIREGMLREGLFEAVIGLPPNLFYGTGIPAAVLVLTKHRTPKNKGKVLFIDASGDFKEGTNQNILRDQDISKIAGAFHAYEDVEKYAHVVSHDEIEANDWSLNISRYVDRSELEERIDLTSAVRQLRALEVERSKAEASMNAFLKDLGYGS
jgi:type I restriction enzyme M protein